MNTVSKILTRKSPHTNYITSSSSVLKAVRAMKQKNRSYLIVRSKGKYEGIVTERNCLYNLILKERDPRTTLVTEIMTIDLPVVGLDDTAEQCMLIINSTKSRHLSVLDEGKFKGIITIHDLMSDALAEHELNHHWYVD